MNKKNTFYTTKEIARMLRIDTSTVCQYFRKGKIPATKVGKLWRAQKEDIDNYLLHSQTRYWKSSQLWPKRTAWFLLGFVSGVATGIEIAMLMF